MRQSYSEWANNSYLLPDPQEHDARGRRATLTDAAGMFNEYNAMRQSGLYNQMAVQNDEWNGKVFKAESAQKMDQMLSFYDAMEDSALVKNEAVEVDREKS